MKIATYSLKAASDSSDQYYEDVSAFADEVIDRIESQASDILNDFVANVDKTCYEKARSRYEYEVELLMLGVLWNEYIKRAVALKSSSAAILSYLAKLREKNGAAKVFSDFARGILETSCMSEKQNGANLESKKNAKGAEGEKNFDGIKKEKNVGGMEEGKNIDGVDGKSINGMDKLIKWLSAAGDFKYYVKRLAHWRDFFNTLPCSTADRYISDISNLALWFEKRSSLVLGCYTKGVDDFLKNSYHRHKWKEDFIFCGSKRVEYHLNMTGAEILNRAFRDEFIRAQEKWLMIPACMRSHNDKNCRAYETPRGYVCKNCTPGCSVNKLTQIGRKYGFATYIVFHESVLFLHEETKEKSIGIIGVACVLNLISGGLKAKEYGFAPQCVLLDYCGCKKHWHKDGIMTEINVSRLMKVFGN